MGNATTEATIDIGLRPSNDAGAIVYRVPANRPGGLQNGYRILSVDGKNITGKSPDEIKALLKGPLGSRVNLQILTNKGEVLTVSAVRELPGIHPPAGIEERQTATAAEKLDLYDYNFLPMPYAEAAQAGRSTVIEPFLTAQANIAATTTDLWFAKSIAAVSIYADLVMFYDRVGRIGQADELVAKINSILRSLPPEDLRSWHAHDYAEYLQRSGRSAQSDQLNEILGRKSNNHQQLDANYALTANALKAIQQKDTNTATDLINALIAHLEETGERASYHNRHQIWNCLALIEKAYVDHGQTAAANKLRLHLIESAKRCQLSDSSLIPLHVDNCLMLTPNGDANSWTQLEKSQVFAIPGTESLTITPAEKLRRFALAYTYTADYKRSRLLLSRAKTLATDRHSKANNIASALPSLSAHNEFAGDETLTLIILDHAIVDLLTGHSNEAQTAVNALVSSDAPIGQTAARKIAQIAYLYAQTSHQVEGEKLLTNLIEKSKNIPASDKNSRIAIPGFYQWKLAELLIKRGQDKEALPLIEAALAQYKTIGPYFGLLFPAAKLFDRLGIYEKAATTYFDAQASLDSHSDYRVVDLRTTKRAILESALKAADKAKNLPDETKAKILRYVAGSIGNSNPEGRKKLEKQEMSLLKPGSRESVDLAISTSRRLKSEKAPTAELIASMATAANLAVTGQNPKAVELLLELAAKEAGDNQTSKAIAHAEEALTIYSASKQYSSIVNMISSSGQSIAQTLYKNGHPAQAEALIKKALAIDSTAGSDKKHVTISSTASLASYYFNVGETKKAESLVNDLFDKYVSSAKVNDPTYMSNQRSYSMTLCRIAASLSIGPNRRAALDIANRLLAEQRKLLLPNDLQQAETLKIIAQLYERSGQLTEAEATYRELMALYAKYPGEHLDLGFRLNFSSLLNRLGKNDEASKLREMR